MMITQQAFEAEAREKPSTRRPWKGCTIHSAEEPADIWELRLARVRDHLTDFYFAYNLPYDLFERSSATHWPSGRSAEDLQISFNPELAPQNMLFEQALAIEKMPRRAAHQQRSPPAGRSKSS